MKILNISLAIVLIIGMISITALSQRAYCADKAGNNSARTTDSNVVRKIEAAIAADRDKIIEEDKAIKAARRKLKEAEEATADSAASEQIKQDIKEREAAIINLKKGIRAKKYQRNDLVYGKTVIPSREYETKY